MAIDQNYESSNWINVYLIELKDGGGMVLGKRVSKNTKAKRLERGLSQQDLANKTGLTVRYISRLENTSPNITLDVLERLVKGLGCSISDLVGDEKKALASGSEDILDQTIHFLQSLKSRI